MSRFIYRIILGMAIALSNPFLPVSAACAEPVYIPPDLAPWEEWVLHGTEDRLCPTDYDADAVRCAWPNRLDLSIEDGQGQFRQEWRTFAETWVTLPGGEGCWPENVTRNGERVPVIRRNGLPSLRLLPGRHFLQGEFNWTRMPEMIFIPAENGLVSLTINGRDIDFPVLDRKGRLWLQKQTIPESAEDRLDLRIFRLVRDTIPMQVTSLVKLDVSGRARELMLPDILLEGVTPMDIQSTLPARLEGDGGLKVQVRPGQWEIHIKTRFPGPVDAIGPVKAPHGTETWCFDPQNQLRLVKVEGVPGIDPNQTDLPDSWKKFSTYLVDPDTTLTFKTLRRGDPDPAPDRLELHRTWWLDFDGRGFTIKDHISGTLSRSWSLSLGVPFELGRVSIDGRDQLITKQAGDRAGVELRRGRLDLDADARIEMKGPFLPAIGWDHDFQSVSATLNLPPGYRLISAEGVDFVPGTWIQKWTLLDIFLALIIAIIIWKLTDIKWGLLALLVMALTFQEPGAPRITWLSLLGATALLKVLPEGWIRKLVNVWRLISIVVLLVLAVPFMIDQARIGLFPQLETPIQMRSFFPFGANQSLTADLGEDGASMITAPQAPPPPPKPEAYSRTRKEKSYSQYAKRKAVMVQDPNALIQTGPGLPTWSWRTLNLGWHGPVDQGQQIKLRLLPPRLHLIICFFRILLLAMLVMFLLEIPRFWKNRGRTSAAAVLVLFLLPLPALGQQQAPPDAAPMMQQQIPPPPPPAESLKSVWPSPDLLEALKSRLLEKPDGTAPRAFYPLMELEARPDTLKIVIEVHAVENSAVPLPSSIESWRPKSILIDGQGVQALARDKDGLLWTLAPQGVHSLTLSGPIPPVNTLQIPLPLEPARAKASVEGWEIQGLGPEGQVEAGLQLIRLKTDGNREEELKTSAPPPYLHVERVVSLGLTWKMQTRVTRLTRAGAPLVQAIPLIPGESVTTAGIRVAQGKAYINMGAGAREINWVSTLEPSNRIVLQAPLDAPWSESWILDTSPIWHVKLPEQPPVIHHQSPEGAWRPQWRPWPGEKVVLEISRPAAVPGQTVTIDEVALNWTPGRRFNKGVLKMNIRSSRGSQQKVVLPEGAGLQQFVISGKSQPIGQEAREVLIPLQPGAQIIQLEWLSAAGSTFKNTGPEVRIGAKAVNAHVTFNMPRNRWILFTGGPRLGPAVLFWEYLVVVLLAALALGKLGWTPLKTRHWILLLLGLTQVHPLVAILVVGWFLALDFRRQHPVSSGWFKFDAGQVLLAGWTLAAGIGLYVAIERGLMGIPDMQISGHFSTDFVLNWTQDRIQSVLPRPFVVSLPLWVYKVFMLLWALWLAMMMVKWLRWGWGAFSEGGFWRKPRLRRGTPPKTGDEFMIE